MPHTLLMTGGTGGFGARLLDELCGADEVVRIYVLAHHSQPRTSSSKVLVRRGDVAADEDLGLDRSVAAEIMSEVTGIVHAAAETRFTAPRQTAWRTNVSGTEHVLQFAARCSRLDRCCLLSTIYVAGKRTGAVLESELNHEAGFVNVYEQSKYESERLARAWMTRLPLSIIRIGTVVGDLPDVGFQPGAIHQAIRLMYRSLAPMVPGRPDNPLDLVPADYAAQATARLVMTSFQPGSTFHICGGSDSPTVGALLDLTMETFMRYRPGWRTRAIERPAIVALETFELFRQSVEEVGDTILRDTTAVISSFAPQLAYPKTFDDSHCRCALDGSGIRRPSVAAAYVQTVRGLIEPRDAKGSTGSIT